MKDDMIAAEEALALAQKEIDGQLSTQDSLFLPWGDGQLAAPIIVHDVFGRPSYWLVPVEAGGHAVGFVRISATGQVIEAGIFCKDPKRLSQCPKLGTGISCHEALKRASKMINASVEFLETPLFVHDGPVGREAWLVQVLRSGQPQRWLFVTSAGVYERPAGEILDDRTEA